MGRVGESQGYDPSRARAPPLSGPGPSPWAARGVGVRGLGSLPARPRDEAAWGFRWHRRIPWPGGGLGPPPGGGPASGDGSPDPQGLALRERLDFLADPGRHAPTDLGLGLLRLPQSPSFHPGRVPQPSGGSRALAIEPLGDILKTRVMLKLWLMTGSMWEAVGPGVQPLPYCPTALLPSRPTTV